MRSGTARASEVFEGALALLGSLRVAIGGGHIPYPPEAVTEVCSHLLEVEHGFERLKLSGPLTEIELAVAGTLCADVAEAVLRVVGFRQRPRGSRGTRVGVNFPVAGGNDA